MEIWQNNKKWMIWEIVLVVAPILLLLASTMHHFQFDEGVDVYRESILVGLEMLLMIFSIFVLSLANLVTFLLLMIKRKFLMVGVHIFQIITSIFLITSAMNIDAPTLIYMT